MTSTNSRQFSSLKCYSFHPSAPNLHAAVWGPR